MADGLSPILYWKDTLDMFQEFLRVLFSACVLLGGLDKFLQSEETADFIYRGLSDGASRLFGSQDADEAYYLLDAEGREGRVPPPVDRTVYTDLAARAAVSLLVPREGLTRANGLLAWANPQRAFWRPLWRESPCALPG